MKVSRSTYSLLLSMIALAGCQMTEAASENALLTTPDEQVLSKIQEAIAPYFNGQRIPLSPSTFTRSPELIIDQQRLDNQGNAKNDMDVTRPTEGSGVRFWLKKQGTDCYIEHEKSGQRVSLSNVDCYNSKE